MRLNSSESCTPDLAGYDSPMPFSPCFSGARNTLPHVYTDDGTVRKTRWPASVVAPASQYLGLDHAPDARIVAWPDQFLVVCRRWVD